MASRTEQGRQGGQIEFISSHHPALTPGKYTIQAIQKLNITAPAATEKQYEGKVQKFRVNAPSTRLNPNQIKAVYPPAGSLGDHTLHLPHIIITPSTLPWEKSGAASGATDVPWLALVLFTADEYAEVTQPTADPNSNPETPAPVMIDVPTTLLEKIMPQQSELRWLTHVRQSITAAGKIEGEEVAVVMGHRLPKEGDNIVHLVSVAGKYTAEGFPTVNTVSDGKVRLVSLKSWRFASIDPKHGFVQLLKRLDQDVFKQAGSPHEIANSYLHTGASLLPHHMREGNKSASWYRGPLVPGYHGPDASIDLPVRTADDLVRFNAAIGMFDVSYAAAWELGRLLMLNSKGAALDFYRWKQANQQRVKAAEQQIDHLPFDGPTAELNLPQSVVSWFERAALLQGVPFHNMVADEKLLPSESIRFFEVDWQWIACLLDGAFSIGRVTPSDYYQDQSMQVQNAQRPNRRMSGFLMRSAAVAGYPHIMVDAFDSLRPNLADETELLFTVNLGDFGQHLKQTARFDTDSMAYIQQIFQDNGTLISAKFTVDQQGWLITDDDIPRYELMQTTNNKIDVSRYNSRTKVWTLIGQIDATLENDLAVSRRSQPLVRAFADIGIEVPEGLYVERVRWVLVNSDSTGTSNFLIERTEAEYNVYRDYRLPSLRFERLSKNVLLGLFEGKIEAVDFHLKPEALHHGVHENEAGTRFKYLRDESGIEKQDHEVDLKFRMADEGIIDVVALASALAKSNEPSEFALQMVEGIPKIRFRIQ